MKLKWNKVLSALLASSMCLGITNVSAYAQTNQTQMVENGYKVYVSTSDVNVTVNETSSTLQPVKVEDRADGSAKKDILPDPSYKKIQQPKPEKAEYALAGYSEKSLHWDAVVKVYYEKDEQGNIKYDENGKPIIDHVGRGSKDNDVIIVNGETVKTLDWPFTVGSRPTLMWLKSSAESTDYISAYCAELGADPVYGSWYTVANLEDAAYYDDATAAKIRAISANGYWGTQKGTGSLEYIKEKVKTAFEAGLLNDTYRVSVWEDEATNQVKTTEVTLTAESIDALTEGEALDATQAAIWVNAFSSKKDNYDDIVFTGVSDEKYGFPNNESAARRKLVCEWLLSLEGQKAADVVVNEDNFVEDIAVTIKEKLQASENGDKDVFHASLKFKLAAIPAEDDNLLLTITYPNGEGGEETVTVRLAGENAEGETYDVLHAVNGYYTIQNLELTENEEFTISMDLVGEQQLEQDIYYFTPIGGAKSSQALLSLAEGTNTIDISMSANVSFDAEECEDRVLHIYKYNTISENDPEGDGTETEIDRTVHTQALANVSFNIYRVCTPEDLESLNGETPAVVLGKEPTEEDVNAYCTEENFVTTVTTDATGHAMYNFGSGEADGVYLVKEESNPAIAMPAKPFFVSIPMTNPTKDGWLYTVYVYPKNDLEPAPVIDKDVTNVGNDYGTFDMDDKITYIIRGEIPAGLATAEKYMLSDTLDTRLDYKGNVIVKLYTGAETEIGLNNIIHYTLTENAATEDKGAVLQVALTKDGMKYVMENIGENAEPEIRVYFEAALNSTADMGTLIPNNATIDYTNSTGYKYLPGEVPEEDRPEVETGGINILKKDAADVNIVLSGAEFKIAREVKEGESTDNRLVVDGKVKQVVYVDFYDATGQKVFGVTTDDNGEAVISGLAYGEYYLIETKAPAGYNLLSKPVKVMIDNQSHTEGAEYVVLNSNSFRLPETGGMGTTIFTAGGMMMLVAAVVLLLKKKNNEEV